MNKKPANNNFQKDLINIYSNKDGSLPDISHLEVERVGRWKLFLFGFILIGLILAGIIWLGFFIFNPDRNLASKSIELSIKGEQNIASGDEISYVIEYKNIDKVGLNELEIIIRYPDGFEFIEADPTPSNDFNSSWKIGDLNRNSSGKIQIRGRLIGEVGSIKTINATASFKPGNFSSIFKETSLFSCQITSSILEIEIEGPTQVLLEKRTVYKVAYKNNSDQDLENIRILIDYPQNFIFQESTPKPFQREDDARSLNNQWLIDKLAKNQRGEIEITGGFIAEPEAEKIFITAQIGFIDKQTEYFSLQQEKKIEIELNHSNLSLNLIVNGSSYDQPINFRQILTYSIIYKNLGKKNLEDVQLNIEIDSDILDWGSLEDKNSGIIKDKKITWDKSQISNLALLRPLDEGSIDFSIRVKDSAQVDLEKNNLQVVSNVFALLKKIGNLEVDEYIIESNKIRGNINTDIQLKVEGRYFDEDNIAVGIGPLPPVVGQKTSFRIYWGLSNSLHEVTDAKVSTILPEGISWENKYMLKVGSISYNPSSNEVVWEIGRIPSGKSFDEINLWFDISVTPTKQQAKKLLILIDQTQFSALDKITDSPIAKSGKAVTSNLEDDPIGGGRGLVIDITE